MTQDNRHPREVNVIEEQEEPNLGFVVDIIDDDPEIQDNPEATDANLQIKPHPSGYQYTLWWKEDGQRKQRDGVIRFVDRRDEVAAGRDPSGE